MKEEEERGDMQNWHNLRGGEWIKQEMEETLKKQAQRKIMKQQIKMKGSLR